MNRSREETYEGAGLGIGKIVGIGAAGVAALVALTVVFGSWYTVDQTKRAVLLRNGAYVETVQPGLHFKWPLVESITKIDMQTHTHTWGRQPSPRMDAYSSDQQPAALAVSVTLHVAPDKVSEIYSRFGGDIEAAITRLIAPHVNEKVKVVFGQFSAARAISERSKLNSEAAAALTESISYDPVFIIESVQIEDIAFSPEYIKSIEARMQAEIEVTRQQQNLAQEKIKAQIAVTQAQAIADSTLAKAKADAEARVLVGDAEAKAIKAKGDALANNPGLVNLYTAERWDGKLPTTMLPGNSTPMIAVK